MDPGSNQPAVPPIIWNTLDKYPSTKIGSKIKKSEIIHYPEFEVAINSIDDGFWRKILSNCARKHLPKGFLYNNGIITHKNIRYSLPSNSYEFAIAAISIFRQYGNILSEKDLIHQAKIEQDIAAKKLESENSNWSNVSKVKSKRTMCVRLFVNKHVDKEDKKSRDLLFTKINLALERGDIRKENIVYRNGQIEQITNLFRSEDNFIIIPNEKKKTRKRIQECSTEDLIEKCSQNFYGGWLMYIEQCKNTSRKSPRSDVDATQIGSSGGYT